jgi:uncharacterized protein YigE (DUF2233 family)
MRKKALTILGFLVLGVTLVWAQGSNPKYQANSWTPLAPGLSLVRWEVRQQSELLDTLVILRVHPDQWSFKVFFNREPKTMKEWQQATGAPVLCNGGFYQENFLPAGRILTNGTSIGPITNKHMKGMFLAEPRKGYENLPKATLIDLKAEGSDSLQDAYEQGIQSFPILLDTRGSVRVNPSNFQAHRTVLALDGQGLIYLLVTEKPFFTLYELGQYLKGLPLGFKFILNLDGGNRSQLLVQMKNFRYASEEQKEGLDPTRLLSPDRTVKMPTVLGLYPRKNS